MLIKHRIDDVNKSLVTIEQPMPAREQVSLEPAFALVFAEHFHHAPRGREEFIIGHGRTFPLTLRHFKQCFQAVGQGFVGPEDPEITLFFVQLRHIA